ncbi:UNVERIFIED_CONTAM: hypothetical protein K2H54_061674 [Gekko kuhli]
MLRRGPGGARLYHNKSPPILICLFAQSGLSSPSFRREPARLPQGLRNTRKAMDWQVRMKRIIKWKELSKKDRCCQEEVRCRFLTVLMKQGRP